MDIHQLGWLKHSLFKYSIASLISYIPHYTQALINTSLEALGEVCRIWSPVSMQLPFPPIHFPPLRSSALQILVTCPPRILSCVSSTQGAPALCAEAQVPPTGGKLGNHRNHFVCFLSLRSHSLALPVFKASKRLFYILPYFSCLKLEGQFSPCYSIIAGTEICTA